MYFDATVLHQFRQTANQGELLDGEGIGKMLALLSVANLLLGVTNSVNASSWSWINLVCATLLTYALGRIHGKKEALEEKRRLTE